VSAVESVCASDLRSQNRHSGQELAAFFAFTFGWTWGLWGIASLFKLEPPSLSNAIMLASAFGPGLGAVFTMLAFEGVTGLRQWMKTCLNWRVGWRWYALATLVPPLIMFVALGIHAALGGTNPSLPDAGQPNAFAGVLAIVPTAATAQPDMLVTALLVFIAAVLLILPDRTPVQEPARMRTQPPC